MFVNKEEDEQKANEWIKFGMRLGVSAALHPFDYAKCLIQLGYEPVAPKPGKTLLGNHAMILPNIFQYVKYIKNVDGLAGCYRGITPKIIGIIIGSIGSEKIATKLGYVETADDLIDDSELSDEQAFRKYERQLKRDIVLHASAIILIQPFHVISMRMMAQFIGNEHIYSSVWQSIKEIVQTEGIFGLFSGIKPKLICDISVLVMSSTTIYLINQNFVRDKEGRNYIGSFVQFVWGSLMYPLQVVASCMTVTGSRLKAGQPPQMPVYKNWVSCWRQLYASGEHKRASSLFFRYYVPPRVVFSAAAPLPDLKKSFLGMPLN